MVIYLYKTLVALTALLHILFFKLESIDFMKPKTYKKLKLSESEAKTIKIWAFNQGFYNLFLALGLIYSLIIETEATLLLRHYLCLYIVGAALVLYFSAPKKYLAALIQGLAPLLALGIWYLK